MWVEIGVNRTVNFSKFQFAALNGHHHKRSIFTINVPVVHMAWDVMILMRSNTLHEPLKGWSLKIEFETFRALKRPRAQRVPSGPKNVDVHGSVE
jgi:hypothetical protein